MIDFRRKQVVSSHHHRSMCLESFCGVHLHWSVEHSITRWIDLVSAHIFSRTKTIFSGLGRFHEFSVLCRRQVTSRDKVWLVKWLLGDWFYFNIRLWAWIPLFNVCTKTWFTATYRKLLDWRCFSIVTSAEEILQWGIWFPLELFGHNY